MKQFRPLLHTNPIAPELLSRLAEIKRFLERHHGDRAFRERLPNEMKSLAEEYGFDLDPDEIRHLWDWKMLLEVEEGRREATPPSEIVQQYRKWMAERFHWRNAVRAACAPADPIWRAWRQRQIHRAGSEMGEGWCDAIIFDTAAIEISKGCSVGCWFCGVDAPRLEDHFYFTPENVALFEDVIRVLVEVVGVEAAAAHFLYWASDPMDNPDYEKFCEVFKSVVGVFPLTTTALALRDVERTRRLLRTMLAEDTGVERFSVLTLPMLNRIHEEFTAEELARVELVLLNKESRVVKADAGRFRAKATKKPELRHREEEKLLADREQLDQWPGYAGPGTIACVSGLLINMVERTVKLITPCKASERWPLGYVVFAEGRFDSGDDLRRLIRSWTSEVMQARLPIDRPVRFRADLEVDISSEGFRVFTLHGGKGFVGGRLKAYYRELGEMIRDGQHDASAIARQMFSEHRVFQSETLKILDDLFDHGFLHDEPSPDDEGRSAKDPEKLVQLVPRSGMAASGSTANTPAPAG